MPTRGRRSRRSRRSAPSSSGRRSADDSYDSTPRAEHSSRLHRDHDPFRHDDRRVPALTTAAPLAEALAPASSQGLTGTLIFFRIVHVWDVSQTEPLPGATHIPRCSGRSRSSPASSAIPSFVPDADADPATSLARATDFWLNLSDAEFMGGYDARQSCSAAACFAVRRRQRGDVVTDLRQSTDSPEFDTVETLILDVLEAWRTSCPRLPVWEDANDRGFIARHRAPGRGALVSVSAAAAEHLRKHRRPSPR